MRPTSRKFRSLRATGLILITLLSWLLLIAGIASGKGADSSLKVSPPSYDFGEVKRLGGPVHTTFTVHNQGNVAILIRRIWTS